MSASVRGVYVSAIRGVRSAARMTGFLNWLDAHTQNDLLLWARSLFAIWDIEDLIRIDCPWWTVAARKKVDNFLRNRTDARVFEWGSGASTVWLSKRAAQVISVEHDERWLSTVREHVAHFPNITLIHVRVERSSEPEAIASDKRGWRGFDFRSYVSAIDSVAGNFDLIIIDGRCRAECLARARRRVKSDGLIVFDNSNRPRYQAAIRSSALHARRTGPLALCLPYPDFTTLLSPSPEVLTQLK
jgi:hypothetical protein